MRRAEYDAIKRKIEAKYRREREALEIVWSLANEDDEQPRASEPPVTEEPAFPAASMDESERTGEILRSVSETAKGIASVVAAKHIEIPGLQEKRTRIPVLQEVRTLVREIEGGITQGVVKQMLSQKYPDANVVSSSVSDALKRLNDLGELELVSKGELASDPYIYRRVLPLEDAVQESPAIEDHPGETNGHAGGQDHANEWSAMSP